MIGVFDSGAGGLFALAELRRLCPHTNIIYLADKENAPYGNKDRDTLVKLVSKDIEKQNHFKTYFSNFSVLLHPINFIIHLFL